MIDLIAVGKILKPIGIRGELKIFSYAENLERFTSLKTAWVGFNEQSAIKLEIIDVRIEQKYVVINLKNVDTVDKADELRNQYIFVPKEEVTLQDGSYFLDDVIGCEVQNEKMIRIGIVEDILKLPANDLWVVKNGTKETLIPAVKEFVRKVDVKRKCITVRLIEGLLE